LHGGWWWQRRRDANPRAIAAKMWIKSSHSATLSFPLLVEQSLGEIPTCAFDRKKQMFGEEEGV